MENAGIPQLYYRYKSATDDEIRKHLTYIKIVKKVGKKYYPLMDKEIQKISAKPRNISLTFNAVEYSKKSIKGLVEFKEVVYLVKSTSRFFLKPDIGEIFDQIDWRDLLHSDLIKAICMNDGYSTLEGTEGEHHLMTVTLLKNK